MKVYRSVNLALLAFFIALVFAQPGEGQNQRRARVPATLVVVDALPLQSPDYIAAVVRRAGGDAVVLPTGGASIAAFDAATRVLVHSRMAMGIPPKLEQGRNFNVITLGVRSSTPPPGWMELYRGKYEELLRLVEEAPIREIPTLGLRGRSIKFLPPAPETIGSGGS